MKNVVYMKNVSVYMKMYMKNEEVCSFILKNNYNDRSV